MTSDFAAGFFIDSACQRPALNHGNGDHTAMTINVCVKNSQISVRDSPQGHCDGCMCKDLSLSYFFSTVVTSIGC